MITPRSTEVQAVVGILNSDEYDNAEVMAKAIIKTVADLLAARNIMYGVAIGFPSEQPRMSGLAMGPYYTAKDAQNALSEARDAGLEGRIAVLSGTGSIRDVAPVRKACSACGHRPELHETKWGCAVVMGKFSCQCRVYVI